jgi:hypothetical protein
VRSTLRLTALFSILAAVAEARVDRIEVTARTPLLDGKPFGLAGSYEKIVGRAHFKIRFNNPQVGFGLNVKSSCGCGESFTV